jgi:IclR family transcriptional regulator, pca regulon regulatory protein
MARTPKKTPTDPTASSLYVQSVDKAMKVLMAFDGSQRQLSLSDIASLTGMDLSAAQRFTHTLATLGYLNKDSTKKYELSPKLLDFTYHYLTSSELVTRAAPYLQQLSAETEEATNLTVIDGTDIVDVQRIVSRHVFNASVIIGTRLPAWCTAPGLALLATYGDAEIEDIFDRSQFVQHTPATVTDRGALKAEIELIRQRRYAHTEDQFFYGDISTAAAILDANGRGIGAVNIAVSRSRWLPERDTKRYADLVISAASSISIKRKI